MIHSLFIFRVICSTIMRHVYNGWFVVGVAGLDIGVVAVGVLHEYIGFGMRSRAKTCVLTLMD